MMAHAYTQSSDDPLSAVLRPPPDETPKQRAAREAEAAAAKKISDDIDAMLKEEAKKRKLKAKREVRVLLLGQSESGKSTCLKQFQILYAPGQFAIERQSWKAVIFLNLVKSIRKIVFALEPSEDEEGGNRPSTSLSFNALDGHPSSSKPSRTSTDDAYAQFAAIKLRLSPLAVAEELLVRQLAGDDGDHEAVQLGTWHLNQPAPSRIKEVFVRSGSNWKKSLSKNKESGSGSDSGHSSIGHPDDPFSIVCACASDMQTIWRDPTVRQILNRKKVRLQDSSGFFLNAIPRITARGYVPSNQDVLDARLKTVGVVEHYFALDKGQALFQGGEKGIDWRIYDVGGHRDQRQIWASFFDDVNAIIFLAPISAFDQVLAEDPRINRIEDSMLLFRAICSNKLLAKVSIVLFLNKIDILASKLEAGVQVAKYVRSFADRPNDVENVTRYFKNKFGAVHKENSPVPGRELYVHLTTVTDTQATAAIISDVREIILRKHLSDSSLL